MENIIYEVLAGNLAFAGCRLSYTCLREFCMRPVDWQYAAQTPRRGEPRLHADTLCLFFNTSNTYRPSRGR